MKCDNCGSDNAIHPIQLTSIGEIEMWCDECFGKEWGTENEKQKAKAWSVS